MEPLGVSGGRSGRNVEDVLSKVGSRVRRALRAREMTLDELGGASGISVAHLSRLESGIRHPSLATVLNVAAGLGGSVSELVNQLGWRRGRCKRQIGTTFGTTLWWSAEAQRV